MNVLPTTVAQAKAVAAFNVYCVDVDAPMCALVLRTQKWLNPISTFR